MTRLTTAQYRQFETEGYLVVRDVLDPVGDLAPVLAEYEAVLDGIARSVVAAGGVVSDESGLPFAERLIRIYAESGQNFAQHFDCSLPQSGISTDTPLHVGPAVFRLLTSPRLLDLVEHLVGPEIFSNPVQHVRMKLPQRALPPGSHNGLVAKIPWHQDNGVVLPEADAAHILTVWLPLTPATEQNGCLQVVPGSHRQALVAHCPTERGVAIPDRLVAEQQAIVLPLLPGSVLLMHQRTIHSSLDNRTDDEVRISMDLRYQPTGEPTGRPTFPGFVARSRAHPDTVLRDPALWAQLWYEARARLAGQADPGYNRWRADAAVCA